MLLAHMHRSGGSLDSKTSLNQHLKVVDSLFNRGLIYVDEDSSLHLTQVGDDACNQLWRIDNSTKLATHHDTLMGRGGW